MQYETLRQVTDRAGVVLADNPSAMTLEGTNTWVLRDAPDRRSAIVVDPGPDDERHFAAIKDAAGSIELILLTHGHADHSAGARRLHELTGAPVRALDPAHRYGGEGLSEGAEVSGAGVAVQIWATPGHTSDSLCFVLPSETSDPGSALELPAAVLTGDTILGRGTTVVAYPDGVLADYLASLHRLATLTGVTVLPGHGPELADAGTIAQQYLAHREQRLEQVRQALSAGGHAMSPRAVVEQVYADVDRALWPAAELSVRAQLAYLRAADANT
ncbi:MAG TPA: MBL fold metallo-hydrolase [Jatrophihabitans sp.]|jgi:glyoxylase-like metal-dependent hydrolase (beta-lactamase superfamily II)